jgi:NADH-quinone oxidoreductase subunit M
MLEELLPYTVIVPAVASLVTLGLNKPVGRWNGLIAFLTSLLSIGVFGLSTYKFFVNPTLSFAEPYQKVYEWVITDVVRLNFGFRADGLSSPIALTIALVAALIALYTIRGLRDSPNMGVFFSLYQLFFVGMVGLTLSTNLMEFFIFFEIAVVASWALINEWGSGEKEKIALKYFLFTEAGALCFLAGVVATYGYLGTLEIYEIHEKIRIIGANPGILVAIVSAMLIGFFVKMAIFPLHSWLPDTYVAAPTPITALLSAAMSGLAAYAIVRIVFLYAPALHYVAMAMIVLAIVTMIYGALNALTQDDFKRLLAYSSISQMGYILLGLGAAALAITIGKSDSAANLAAVGAMGSMFHYIAHAMGKAVLFLLVGVFALQVGITSISRMGGLAGKMPYTSVAMFIGFFTLMGVPFTSGFISEWTIFTSAIGSAALLPDALKALKILIMIVAIIATALTFAYALWSIRRMLFGQLPSQLNGVKEASPGLLAPLMVLALISIALGLYPAIFTEELKWAIAGILNLKP